MPTPITIPKATITMEEANIMLWRKLPGQPVAAGEILYEMETDKVVVEVPAPASGVLLRIDVLEGVARLDQPLGWIGEPGEVIPALTAPEQSIPPDPQGMRSADSPAAAPGFQAATPAARRLARELGINLANVTGTGPGGRILEIDVQNKGRRV